MVNFRPLAVGLILAAMFLTAFIAGLATLAYDNDADYSVTDDSIISGYYNNLSDTLDQSYTDSVGLDKSIGNSSLTLTSSIPFLDSMGSAWKTIRKAPVQVWDSSMGLLRKSALSGTQINLIIGSVSAILIISLALAVWKLLSTGESG